MSNRVIIDPAVINDLKQGKVIAYPTEAVFGLGCDPDNQAAVEHILQIKQRPMSKGLILIAGDINQLKPYIDLSQLEQTQLAQIAQHWPGPYTYVMPASKKTAKWITGDFDTVAVRVTAHPVVIALCRQFAKPLVSTSANLSGEPAINDLAELTAKLSDKVAHIVAGEVDVNRQPSTIIDARSGAIYRS